MKSQGTPAKKEEAHGRTPTPTHEDTTRRVNTDSPVVFVSPREANLSKDRRPEPELPFRKSGKVCHSPPRPSGQNTTNETMETEEDLILNKNTQDTKRKRGTTSHTESPTEEDSDESRPTRKNHGKKMKNKTKPSTDENNGSDTEQSDVEVAETSTRGEDLAEGIHRLRELKEDFANYARKNTSTSKPKFLEFESRLAAVFATIQREYETFSKAQSMIEEQMKKIVLKNKKLEDKIRDIESSQKKQEENPAWRLELQLAMETMMSAMDKKLERALPKAAQHTTTKTTPAIKGPTSEKPAEKAVPRTTAKGATEQKSEQGPGSYAEAAARKAPQKKPQPQRQPRKIKDLQKMIPAQETKKIKPANWGVLRAPVCTDPIKLLKEVFNPRKEGVAINSIIYTSNKNIIVRTNTEQDIQKLQQCKTLKERGFEMATVTDKKPRIMIYGADEGMTKEDLLGQIIDNNEWAANYPDENELQKHFLPLYSFRPKKESSKKNWIVEITPALRKVIEGNGWKIKTLWARLRVADYLDAVRCFKCQHYGHPAKYCKHTNTTCGHCGQAGHNFKTCLNRGQPPVCTPCKAARLASDHSVNDKGCPSKIRAIKERIRNTSYAQ